MDFWLKSVWGDRWHVTGETGNVTSYMWYATHDRWQVTHDISNIIIFIFNFFLYLHTLRNSVSSICRIIKRVKWIWTRLYKLFYAFRKSIMSSISKSKVSTSVALDHQTFPPSTRHSNHCKICYSQTKQLLA